MTKIYKIVNNFQDVHTGEWHTPKDEPISLTDERVKEIETVEKEYDHIVTGLFNVIDREIKEELL